MNFEETIKSYLDKQASIDKYFAEKYNPKNIKNCCSYIVEKAKEQAQDGTSVIEDATVYQWARDFYNDEIDPKNYKPKTGTRVMTSETKESTHIEKKEETPKPKPVKKEVKKSFEQFSLFDFED